MDISEINKRFYGVQEGLISGQNDRTEELNVRILERFEPTQQLKPNFDPRPVPTKYSLFPIFDRRTPSNVQFNNYLDYNPEQSFNPGNDKGPVDGFINHVDVETELRNQTRKINRDDIGLEYIPSTNSDLYISQKLEGSQQMVEERELLFKKFDFSNYIHPNIVNREDIGKEYFYNHTRTQLRGSAPMYNS
jgi:hypothetical protein